MSALRKDLFDRRLWPLAALLVAALLAVPLLTLEHAAASPAPAEATLAGPSAAAEAAAGRARATMPQRKALGGTVRDPFAVAATPSSTPAVAVASVSAPSAPAPGAATANAATVSPALVAATPAPSTPPSGSGSSASSTSASVPATSTAEPEAPARPSAPPDKRAWTIYAVDVRVGADAGAPIRRDVARLTPLPSPARPVVMYMGVMDGGKQAAFALNANIAHAGPGTCRPNVRVCSVILLRAGQTETLTVSAVGGGQHRLVLRVLDIRSHVAPSHAEAFSAYERHSAAGLCDLALADPMSYSPSAGTLTGVAGDECKDQAEAVPFPSTGPRP